MTMLAMTLVLGGLAIRGVDQVLTRELAGRAGTTLHGRQALANWSVRRVGLGVSFGVSVFVLWVIFIYSHPKDASSFLGVLELALPGAVLVVIIAGRGALSGALNGYSASVRSQTIGQIVQNGAVLLLLVVILAFGTRPLSVDDALWLQVTGYFCAVGIGIYWIAQLDKERARVHRRRLDQVNLPALQAKKWSKASRYFLLTSIAGLLMSRLDVVLISAVTGSHAVGIYVAGARLGQVGMLAALAVNIVLGPRIANAYQTGNRHDLEKLLAYGWGLSIPFACLEIIVGWAFGSYLVRLFGSAYSASAQTFAWVITGYALWTLAAPAYARLSMTGREHLVAGISWVVLVTNIVLLIILTPIYKATGAAAAMAVGYGVGTIIIIVMLKMSASRLADIG